MNSPLFYWAVGFILLKFKKYTRKSIVIKGLKPNTTYYFRQRYKAAVKTDAGTKYLIAPWSKSLKIKTLAK